MASSATVRTPSSLPPRRSSRSIFWLPLVGACGWIAGQNYSLWLLTEAADGSDLARRRKPCHHRRVGTLEWRRWQQQLWPGEPGKGARWCCRVEKANVTNLHQPVLLLPTHSLPSQAPRMLASRVSGARKSCSLSVGCFFIGAGAEARERRSGKDDGEVVIPQRLLSMCFY